MIKNQRPFKPIGRVKVYRVDQKVEFGDGSRLGLSGDKISHLLLRKIKCQDFFCQCCIPLNVTFVQYTWCADNNCVGVFLLFGCKMYITAKQVSTAAKSSWRPFLLYIIVDTISDFTCKM